MMSEHLIGQNQTRHQELLREAEQWRAIRRVEAPSVVSQALARTGDLLVAVGQGLQRRYRRMEQGVGEYANSQRFGRAL